MKMITEFANRISKKMVHRGIVKEEDVELYQYGIESGIMITGNLMASAVFGILTGRLGVVLVFLLFYSTLRSYSGGVHCKSKAGCFILSILILFIPVFSGGIMKEIFSFRVFFIVGITALVIILALSPVESPNKPLDKDEWKYYRRISQLIASIQVCVLVFLFCWGNFPYFYAGYSSFILIALFMFMEKIASMHYI